MAYARLCLCMGGRQTTLKLEIGPSYLGISTFETWHRVKKKQKTHTLRIIKSTSYSQAATITYNKTPIYLLLNHGYQLSAVAVSNVLRDRMNSQLAYLSSALHHTDSLFLMYELSQLTFSEQNYPQTSSRTTEYIYSVAFLIKASYSCGEIRRPSN